MTPISSTSPSIAANGAHVSSADTDDTGTQADEFSALLGSLIVPVTPPTTPQNCPPPPAEAQTGSGTGVEAITSPAQSYGFFAQTGPLTDDGASSGNAGAVKLNTIFEQLGVDQNSQFDQKLTDLPAKEADFSNNAASAGNGATELPTGTNQGAELVRSQTPPAEKLSPSVVVEVPRTTTGSTAWLMRHLTNLDYSPSPSAPATLANTINSVRESGDTLSDSQSPSEISGVKMGATPTMTELLQAATSTETGAQSGTSDGNAKDSTAPEIAIESAPKSGKARSAEAPFSAESLTSTHAATSQATVQEPASQVSHSVASQLSHAMAQVAGEVLAHREPRSIRIRLRPEELGEVHINITTDASGHLSAQISAEHDVTRRAIAGGLDHLRETLEQAGINVDQLNVSVNQYTSNGTGAQSDAGSQQAARQSAIAAQTTSSLNEGMSEGKSSQEEDRLLSMRA